MSQDRAQVGIDPADGLLAQVRRELDEEVRRLRVSGAFPPSFEHRLDQLFAKVVPAASAEREAQDALDQVERASHVDIEVPLGSRVPGVSLVKRLLRKLMAWYLNYLVQQVNRFTAAAVRALRMLHERVSRLEDEERSRHPLAPPPARRKAEVDISGWTELVRARLAGAAGPVLHADCGEGRLLAALVADGLDAYGTDPRAEMLDEAVIAGLEVRWEEANDHLRGLPDASLAGLVLSGCVDRLDVGAQRELAALAGTKLGAGATVVLLGTTPAAWAAPERSVPGGPASTESAIVESDLAPGRPLHPGTWCHLLAQEGLAGVETVMGPSQARLERVTGSDEVAAVLNANLARLEEVLYGPVSFAVVGTRAAGPTAPVGAAGSAAGDPAMTPPPWP